MAGLACNATHTGGADRDALDTYTSTQIHSSVSMQQILGLKFDQEMCVCERPAIVGDGMNGAGRA